MYHLFIQYAPSPSLNAPEKQHHSLDGTHSVQVAGPSWTLDSSRFCLALRFILGWSSCPWGSSKRDSSVLGLVFCLGFSVSCLSDRNRPF